MSLRLLVVLAGLLQLCSAQQINWPDVYTAKGNIILPYGDILEPFVAYVDLKNKMSRFDYYGGDAIVLSRGDMGDFGTMFKIVPETTYQFANRKTCFTINGFKGAAVMPQPALPDASLYTYVADYVLNGVKVMIYQSYTVEENKENNYTLFVRKSDNHPVQLFFKGYDRLFGSHYDEYFIQYTFFQETIVDRSVFNYNSKFTCINFPGPGVTMAENPFFEYFGAEGYESHHQTAKMDGDFEGFKGQHGKTYDSETEELRRKTHFKHNHRFIHSMNRRDLSYKLAVNHLTDRSDDEVRLMRGYRHSKTSPRGELYVPTVNPKDVPVYMNWWLRGAVTPVKDQGICGSCWSFGTTGTLEGSAFIKTGRLFPLSEQALMDCSWGEGNNACDGGESERAFQWIIKNGCLPSSATYGYGRYLMQDGFCTVNMSSCGVSISKFMNSPTGNTSALVMAIFEHGPISVAIDASLKTFSFYSSGVYYDAKCGNTTDSLDHQVLAVGYGTLNSKDFWLVKNSWSTHWGNDGYILMSRRDNNCGVATDASWGILV